MTRCLRTFAPQRAAAWALIVLTACAGTAFGDSGESKEPAPADAEPVVRTRSGLEALVPEIANQPYHLEPGRRPYLHRFALTPGYGSLGSEALFTLRLAYNPNSWLGYEGSLGHNPGQSVHAVLHSLSALLRYPLPGRFQPYVSLGYGMMMVSPGPSLNADPVTKNALTAGGGLEFFIRNDLALRAEVVHATVFGSQRNGEGIVAYPDLQQTIGLSFYRTIAP